MSKRQSIVVPGYTPVQPIPSAARKGPLVITGGIEGIDPTTGKIAATREEQIALTFSNLERILAAAGCAWSDVVKLDFFIRTPDIRAGINEHWHRVFANPDDRPARQVRVSDALPEGVVVQCVAVGWVD